MLSNLSVGFHEDIPFDSLPIPFFCVSSDLVSAKANYHTKGSLPKAVRSTISIPGVFAPVRTNNRILVDGGTRNNFPVDIAKAMGADIIIGVEVAKRGTTYSQVNSVVDIVNCMITMLGDDARSNKSFEPDMLIKPETGDMNMLSFNSEAIAEMIDYGYKAAQERADDFHKIKEQLGNSTRNDTIRRKKAINLYNQNVMVSGIMVNGIDKDEQKIFRKVLDLRGHREISQKEIEDAMCRVMALGAFEKVNYSLVWNGNDDTFTLVFCWSLKRQSTKRITAKQKLYNSLFKNKCSGAGLSCFVFVCYCEEKLPANFPPEAFLEENLQVAFLRNSTQKRSSLLHFRKSCVIMNHHKKRNGGKQT